MLYFVTACSAVVGFDNEAAEFLADMKDAGVTIQNANDRIGSHK